MALKYIKVKVKSEEEIKATLKDFDDTGDKIVATHGKDTVEVSNDLLSLCGEELKVLSTKRQSHPYDYSHLLQKETEDSTKYFTYVYFKEDWLTPVVEEEKEIN